MPGYEFLLVAGISAAVGAIVQSGIGLGLGLVAAPVVTLVFPSLMPGSLLIAAAVLPMFVVVREIRHADWRGLRWAFLGRVAGTPLGIWLVVAIPQRFLGLAVGGMVLVAIGASLWKGRVPRTAGTLVAAGVLAGGMGTATSIGGPPIALVYQRETGPMIRATLSIFFTVSAMISVGTLAAVHRLPERQVMAGLALTPFVIVGFAVSGPLRRYLDGGRMRSAVLIVTGMSALTLIIRSVV
jgi:uncharacterized protein